MTGLLLAFGVIFGFGGTTAVARRRRRPVRREPINIDLVLEEKYPNRARAAARVPVPAGAGAAGVTVETLAVPFVAEEPADPEADAPEWPAPAAPAAWYPPPALPTEPWTPVPGEPDAELFVGPPRRPSRIVDTGDGPSLVAGPYEALRLRRDRVARQAAAAFAEVHKLRTESLRRASQAEHNAELATTARSRATRMTRESRKYEAQGRVRSRAVPDAGDAFQDVHRFRVEALRRAHEAEHGAEAVANARQRATRLLADQRRIEAEMHKMRRGGSAGETL